jgi:hypothetical protein
VSRRPAGLLDTSVFIARETDRPLGELDQLDRMASGARRIGCRRCSCDRDLGEHAPLFIGALVEAGLAAVMGAVAVAAMAARAAQAVQSSR